MKADEILERGLYEVVLDGKVHSLRVERVEKQVGRPATIYVRLPLEAGSEFVATSATNVFKRTRADDRRVKPLPCPFCGLPDPHVGVDSSCAHSVQCLGVWDEKAEGWTGCRVKIVVGYPEILPNGCRDVGAWCERRAIEIWNRRRAG